MCFTTAWWYFYISNFYIYSMHTKLMQVMCQKWRFIYVVTGSHTQLSEGEITKDFSMCDSVTEAMCDSGFSIAGKNTGVILVPCLLMEVCLYSYFWCCGYFWSPWLSFVMTDEFSVRVREITSRIGVTWTHSLPFYF